MNTEFRIIPSTVNPMVANNYYEVFTTYDEAMLFLNKNGNDMQLQVVVSNGCNYGYGMTIMGAKRNLRKNMN